MTKWNLNEIKSSLKNKKYEEMCDMFHQQIIIIIMWKMNELTNYCFIERPAELQTAAPDYWNGFFLRTWFWTKDLAYL